MNRTYQIQHLLGKAQTLPGELKQLTFGPPTRYFDDLCEMMLMDMEHNSIEEALEVLQARRSKFSALKERLTPWQEEISDLAGEGDEWDEVEAIGKEIRQHIDWVRDLEQHARLGPMELRNCQKKGTLLYQRELGGQ
ncbi:hypothetical protein MD484_g1630, partial [Candolleomyces efflorescens]